MEISFICVNVPQKNNFYSVFRVSPVSISEKRNQLTTIFLPESPTLEWHIELPFHSILFLYFWNVHKNLQEIKKKKKKHYRKQLTEEHRAVARKAAPPSSEPQWRLWEERTEHREQGSSSQNTAPQRPGRPPASHMTPSPSCALLGLRVFICENTHRASLRGNLGHLNKLQQWRVLWNHHKNKDFSSLLLLEVLVRDLLYS